jgi:hypothetical protein
MLTRFGGDGLADDHFQLIVIGALVAGCAHGGGTAVPSALADPWGSAMTIGTAPSGGTPDTVEGPPAARLQGAGLGGAGVTGAEGSFTWNGFGSDGPWVVHPEPIVRGTGPWNVTFDPRLPIEGWSARWAPVQDGVAQDPTVGASGAGGPIIAEAPGTPGAWSLQVEASFGVGRRATWYWTMDVLP